MLKFVLLPKQPFKLGVTVIIAVTIEFPLFDEIKEAILPRPLEDNPIEGSLFTQSKEVPATEPVKLIGKVEAPLQIV